MTRPIQVDNTREKFSEQSFGFGKSSFTLTTKWQVAYIWNRLRNIPRNAVKF